MARATPERRASIAWVPPLLIVVITFVAFLPILHNGFVSWDDRSNFLENPHYRGLGAEQLKWMWTTFRLGHYVPLSWMTLGLDYTLWGMNASGYHFTSLVLHAANAVLVFYVAKRLVRLAGETGGSSAPESSLTLAAGAAALLFAVHPLRVESVAWATERRDVLSLFFLLASVIAYLRWCEREASGSSGRRWYWVSLLAFACGILSKATVMTLPAVLAILNVYPLKRLGPGRWRDGAARRVYLELVPFALLSAGTVVLSIIALHPPGQLGLPAKLAVSAYSLVFYCVRSILPAGLAPLYEMPQHVEPTAPLFLLCDATAIALCAIAWALRHRWPGLTTAWAVFVVVSLPMLGIVQNGPQIAADRYTYHSSPALAILVGGALFLHSQPASSMSARRAFAIGAVLVLGLLTWTQSQVWHDSNALWSRVLEVDDNSSIAHSAMASLLFQENRVDEAVAHSERAVALAPDYAEAHNDLGVGYARRGLLNQAVAEYERALQINPSYDEAHSNLGVVIGREGKLDSAVAQYREAIALNPDNADAQVNWGNALVKAGDPAGAIPHYEAALVIRPDHSDARLNWGVALAVQGKFAEAIDQFRQALAIDPGNADAKKYLDLATQRLNAR